MNSSVRSWNRAILSSLNSLNSRTILTTLTSFKDRKTLELSSPIITDIILRYVDVQHAEKVVRRRRMNDTAVAQKNRDGFRRWKARRAGSC